MKVWKLLKRTKVFSSRFVNVYADRVELANGKILDDYTVVEKPSIVMIVATNTNNDIIVLREYKHGAGEVLYTLPAGHKEDKESTISAAQRELTEETGYTGGSFADVGVLCDYPSKDIHKVFVVRAKELALITKVHHEETEVITWMALPIEQLKAQISNGEWKSSSALAALVISGVLL